MRNRFHKLYNTECYGYYASWLCYNEIVSTP